MHNGKTSLEAPSSGILEATGEGGRMSDEAKKDFLSEDTEKKVAEFEAKLKAQQAAMPDTSIRAGAGGINVLENYYFKDGEIPIYDSGTNKQIDNIDMKVDRMRRSKHDARIEAEIEQYMIQLHQELEAKEAGLPVDEEEMRHQKTATFVYAVPAILVVFGIIVVLATNLA